MNAMVFERSDEMPRGMDGVYGWVDRFSFSRPMKNPARDFSDAVLLAEILAQLVPAWVQLHNYPSTLRFQQKLSNWETLNRKVLTRLKCSISHKHQEDLANAVPGAIELLLIQVKRATANSPFLLAKNASTSIKDAASTSPRSRFSSTACSPPATPTPTKQKLSPSSLKIRTSESSREQDTIATSFSKLLQLMSDTTHEFDDAMKPFEPKPRNRANTTPGLELINQPRRTTAQPLTPNYAKPTLSTIAMARPASVDAKPRQLHASPFVFPSKTDQVSEASPPEKLLVVQGGDNKKYLPSDTNEFQEGSFVYFLSSEALPAAYLSADPEDQAQVARVIKTLPSGECTLQLYRRVPSRDSPQNNPNKSRSYFATPHFIDCCGTLLHTIPNITFDPQTNTCEWSIRGRKPHWNENTKSRAKPAQNNSPPTHRHFYTQVLTRLTFTPANLAEPISQTTESVSPGVCLPCRSFVESFRVPVAPTVFPKVQVSLVLELPERFPR